MTLFKSLLERVVPKNLFLLQVGLAFIFFRALGADAVGEDDFRVL